MEPAESVGRSPICWRQKARGWCWPIATPPKARALDARFQPLDVGDEAAVATVVAEVEELYGAIDVLVTCAGVLQRTLPPSRLSWKEWDRIQRVHLRGTYACCREVGPRMAARFAELLAEAEV